MTKVTAELADKLAKRFPDNRAELGSPDWEEDLWIGLGYFDLDTKQVDILFDMIVARWNAAERASKLITIDPPINLFDAVHAGRSA